MKNVDEMIKQFETWKAKTEAKLLMLYRKKNPTDNDRDKITHMEKQIEKKQALINKKLARRYRELEAAGNSSEAQDARRKRTHKLCQLGGLVEKAGWGEVEDALLLGMLLKQKKYLAEHPHMLDTWTAEGNKALEQPKATATDSTITNPAAAQQSRGSNTLAALTTGLGQSSSA